MGFCFGKLAYLQDLSRFLNDPRHSFRYDGFIYSGERNFKFFEDGFHPKAKMFKAPNQCNIYRTTQKSLTDFIYCILPSHSEPPIQNMRIKYRNDLNRLNVSFVENAIRKIH